MQTIENVPNPGRTDLYVLKHTLTHDLALTSDSLTFDPANPAPGTSATVRVNVENRGDLNATDIAVDFYDGNPELGGSLIAQVVIPQLMPGGSQEVETPWDVPSDLNAHKVFAVVDPALSFDDRDRSNNTTSGWSVLPDLLVETVQSERLSETQVAITARIKNGGVIPSGGTKVSWRLENEGGQEIGFKDLETISAGSFRECFVVWDATDYISQNGSVNVYAVVDPDEGILEGDESNSGGFTAVTGLPVDSDGDGLSDSFEDAHCTKPDDADSDDDGLTDGEEDANHDGVLDSGETNPCKIDSDDDGIQDGTELRLTADDIGSDTNTSLFQPDLDPSTTTNPRDKDTDHDGIPDGVEDANKNGRLDDGETDASKFDSNDDILLMIIPTIAGAANNK